MKIITVSREFGSGGRELGKRLADALGFDYYDREIIAAIAGRKNLDEGYVERRLEQSSWQTMPLTFRRSFTGGYMRPVQTALLVEQKRVIEGIAQRGRDCVIVGRNADVLLEAYRPFRIFVCADQEAKVRRCMERAAPDEQLTPAEIERNARRIDRNRAKTREMLLHGAWGSRESYQLIVNTTDWEIKELTPAVADFAARWFERKAVETE